MINRITICAVCACATFISPYVSATDQPGSKLEAAFKKADTDSDGTLTRDEAKALRHLGSRDSEITPTSSANKR